jgi:hypothetical protein
MLDFDAKANLVLETFNQYQRVMNLLRAALPGVPDRPWHHETFCRLYDRAETGHRILRRPLHPTELLCLLSAADQLLSETQELIESLRECSADYDEED